MLHRLVNGLRRDTVVAVDGPLGTLDDLYIDDRDWTVRYFVVDTGDRLPGHRVFIAPGAVESEKISDAGIPVALDSEQVRGAPGVETDLPVSRRLEQACADYYGCPRYGGSLSLWGAASVPPGAHPGKAVHTGEPARKLASAERAAQESHLRSGLELVGYGILARDGTAGHVEDFLVDDRGWAITDMVVDTRDWLPAKRVLVSPDAVDSIDGARRAVLVRLSRNEIAHSPRTN
jgi:hypothetical protein